MGGACGAADEPVDPADLELRDLLGVAPRVAAAWDADQREAARHVLAAGLVARDPEPLTLAPAPIDEARVIGALAVADQRLYDRERDALGLVLVEHLADAADGRAIDAPRAVATLAGEPVAAAPVLELDERAWPCAGACSFDALAALAADAAPGAARVRVVPVIQLSVIAALLPDADVPTLLVNPIVTAVGEPPIVDVPGSSAGGGAASADRRATPGRLAPAPGRTPVQLTPLVTSTWIYEPNAADCASTLRAECADCLGGGACQEIWPGVSGQQACTTLDMNATRNYPLLCANLAVSLGDVGACVQRDAPGCMFDAVAISDPNKLSANAVFVDDPTCRSALDACLEQLFGAADGDGGCDCRGCGSCDCSNESESCSSSDSNMQSCDGCKNDDGSCNACGDSSGGNCGSCSDSGGGGGCNNGGSGGSCSVARRSSARGYGLAAGLVWVLLPVPAALLARRRARRAPPITTSGDRA